ncbi:MAG TPA: pyrroline-5-carboxylate reductase [Lachnospiraceae bacterium]|nr:pyrroline-5-carboxylate reductase [Lachnospiraceae bacterium]
MRLGFIGCGNMAEAIMGGVIKNNFLNPEDIIGSDIAEAGRDRVKQDYGIRVTESNLEVAENSDILILAVKPQFYQSVIEEIRDAVEKQLIITIAPGKTLNWLEEQFGKPVKIFRAMPNTAALVLEGMTAACMNKYVTEEEKDYACHLLGCFGEVEIVPERLFDAVVAVSGSSPAYVFMMIEAMADAAVSEGMPRLQAYKFAAQAVMGSAKMVLDLKQHPGELKDMVCSPGGTTIEAVRVLEERGFRGALIEAMKVCADVSRSL